MENLRISNSPSEEETIIELDLELESKKHWFLDRRQKQTFHVMLKHLLEDSYSLQEGTWAEEQHAGNRFRLHYGKNNCHISIFDLKGHIQTKEVASLDIYLTWREGIEESLSLENLQRVQNELKLLGFKNEKVNACFSLVRNEFIEESLEVQKNCKLKIICEEVALKFASYSGCSSPVEITVIYDDKNNRAVYYLRGWVNGKYNTKISPPTMGDLE